MRRKSCFKQVQQQKNNVELNTSKVVYKKFLKSEKYYDLLLNKFKHITKRTLMKPVDKNHFVIKNTKLM